MNFYEGKLELTTGLPYVLDHNGGCVYYKTSYSSETGSTNLFKIADAGVEIFSCRSSWEYRAPSSWDPAGFDLYEKEDILVVYNVRGRNLITTSMGWYDSSGATSYLHPLIRISVMNVDGIVPTGKGIIIAGPTTQSTRIQLDENDAYMILSMSSDCSFQYPSQNSEYRYMNISVSVR